MTSYALGICDLCALPMTLEEIAEGVLWEERERGWLWGSTWVCGGEEEEVRIAHRRCWKELAEVERKHIRKSADKKPRSLGQQV